MAVSYGIRETMLLVALCLAASCSSVSAAAYYSTHGYDGDACMTPNGAMGVCRVIGQCPSLLALVSQRPSQENLYHLNNLRCGFYGSVPIVCCTDGVTESSPPFTQPSPTRPTQTRPTQTRPTQTRPTPTRPTQTRPTATRPTQTRPTPTRPTRPQTTNPRPPPPPTPTPVPTPAPPPVAEVDSIPPDVTGHPNMNLLPEDYCSPPGIDRIVGGKVADVFAYPWIARLGYLSRRSTWKPVAYHCAGSLINSRYVLTAAHCIITRTDLYLSTVKLGEHTIDKPIDCRLNGACLPAPIDRAVEKTEVHPLYDPQDVGSHHDIALARLAAPVDFLAEDFVRPVCLPVSPDNQRLRLSGPLVAAGWGLTEEKQGSNALRDVLLPVMPFEQCRKVFTQPGLQKEIIPQQLCAGGLAGMDSCNGDSGGPLMLEADVGTESKAVLFGIVSFGHNDCGTEGVPGVYTRVAFYVKWILDTIKP